MTKRLSASEFHELLKHRFPKLLKRLYEAEQPVPQDMLDTLAKLK